MVTTTATAGDKIVEFRISQPTSSGSQSLAYTEMDGIWVSVGMARGALTDNLIFGIGKSFKFNDNFCVFSGPMIEQLEGGLVNGGLNVGAIYKTNEDLIAMSVSYNRVTGITLGLGGGW